MKPKLLNGLLDPDEREAYILRKIEGARAGYPGVPFRDPLEGVLASLPAAPDRSPAAIPVLRVGVEPWLTPTPPPEMLFMLTVENFVTFIDSDGCLEYAGALRDRVKGDVIPDLPVMVGVDHSLSGGSIEALADEYGGENLRLVVLDSHFDFIPPSIRCGLIQYDLESNPETKFSPADPYIYGRRDSYNADSFLSFITKKVPPENIFVIGVSDYPPKAAEETGDERVERYVSYYKDTLSSGVHLLRKDDLHKAESALQLSRTDKPYTYVSIDVDVCANTSLKGARFLDYHGISHSDLYRVVAALRNSFESSQLVGLDLMEFDVFTAGTAMAGKTDRTYAIMAEVLRRLTL